MQHLIVLILIGITTSLTSFATKAIEPVLHQAIRAKQIDQVKSELSNPQTNIHERNNRGQLPLTIAILLSNEQIVQLLLDNGAKLDLKDHIDKRAFDIADRSIRRLLKKYKKTANRGSCRNQLS